MPTCACQSTAEYFLLHRPLQQTERTIDVVSSVREGLQLATSNVQHRFSVAHALMSEPILPLQFPCVYKLLQVLRLCSNVINLRVSQGQQELLLLRVDVPSLFELLSSFSCYMNLPQFRRHELCCTQYLTIQADSLSCHRIADRVLHFV